MLLQRYRIGVLEVLVRYYWLINILLIFVTVICNYYLRCQRLDTLGVLLHLHLNCCLLADKHAIPHIVRDYLQRYRVRFQITGSLGCQCGFSIVWYYDQVVNIVCLSSRSHDRKGGRCSVLICHVLEGALAALSIPNTSVSVLRMRWLFLWVRLLASLLGSRSLY